MRFSAVVDLYISDFRSQGRINSDRTEVSYRAALQAHAEDVSNRDPRSTGRTDVKRTLRRYPHPNTQRRQRSMLVSFYRWMVWEGLRSDNPAEQTTPPRPRRPQVYRLTFAEVRQFLEAASSDREQRVAFIGVCAGLRRDELRLLQGRHLAREGWVWVSSDIAKGGRERWVPVMADLEPVVTEIRRTVALGHYVLPAQQYADPPHNQRPRDYLTEPGDGKTIWRICRRIGVRAGIAAPVNPHMMRHAFAEHVARYAGVAQAQSLLGHADISTTQGYIGVPTLDEIAESVAGVTFLGTRHSLGIRGAESQSWRRWESNPRTQPFGPQSETTPTPFSELLARLFASPVLREAARGMAG